MSYTSWIEAVKSVGLGKEPTAADKAKEAGLVSIGGNAWAKEKGGPTVANTVGDKLIPVGDGEKPEPDEPEVRAAVSPEKISKSIEDARAKLAEKAKKPEEKLSDEDVQTTNALLDDLEKLNGMSGDERENYAKEMITKYKLSTNEGQPPKKKRALTPEQLPLPALEREEDQAEGFGILYQVR